ncbi:MAG TPA: type VI secretion system tip protein TssI/VgrG [Stellaceae bacterium]|nr:type VI secretion system tip protein TssI/VgrG [Stellaceae bacterium]
MSDLSQQGRIGQLTTPAGADTFVLNRFEGTEGLGQLFEYRIGALSLKENYDLNSMIGQNCDVKITGVDGLERHFNGVLTEANYTGGTYALFGYQLVLRPWLHLLSRTSDCRIFSNMKPNKIITQVFSDRGFNDFRENLKEDYPTLEYTVQYRETDLNFVCRLMEKYGIYYYFEHTSSKHTMVLCDSPSCHDKIPGLQPVPLLPVTQETRRDRQQFDSWSSARALQTGKDALNDYFYEKPSQDLLAKADKHGQYEHSTLETYDYPGGYDNKSDGEKWAKVRVEAVQALDDHRIAIGAAPSLFPGGKLTHENNPAQADNKDYVVLRCTHSYVDQTYISGGGAPVAYAGTYEMMDSSRQFRSLLTTRRAVVIGWQSALVIGKQGEEIDVDKEGRILVQFYWDRKKDSSRRIRVVQFWAGKTRGAWFCPRIGDEVLVQYEDGDPDRPICVGSVYNGENTVPTTLPDYKTHSGILTKSSKNSDGYHMFLFDDTAGSERVKLRSQKDLMFKALNNEQRDILMSQTENIGQNETINVGMGPDDLSKGGGNWTLNAFTNATINVGPPGMPLTQIVMTQQDITLNVGPEGLFAKIVMNASGITFSVMGGLTTEAWSPTGIASMAPTISETALAAITMTAPAGVTAAATLNTPALVAGGAIVGGIPI